MMRNALFGYVIAGIALVACPPDPLPPDGGTDAGPPTPVADAGPPPAPVDASTPAVAACANLAALGCPEGAAATCAPTIDHVLAVKLTPLNVACLTSAKSKTAVRACGPFVRCP